MVGARIARSLTVQLSIVFYLFAQMRLASAFFLVRLPLTIVVLRKSG
jgi:hypothetical protein